MNKKVALVTGGARGIGEAISRTLAENGWKVIIHCGKSVAEAEELCRELEDAEYISADLADPASVACIFEKYPQIDALVNNAGVALVELFDTVPEEKMRRMFEINLFAPMNLSRIYLPGMIKRKSGVIGVRHIGCTAKYNRLTAKGVF